MFEKTYYRFDPRVAAFATAQFLQPLQKRRDLDALLRIALTKLHEHADSPHLIGLLREPPRMPDYCRATNNFDEISPLHAPPREDHAANVRS